MLALCLAMTAWVTYRLWTIPEARTAHRASAVVLPLFVLATIALIDWSFLVALLVLPPLVTAWRFTRKAHGLAEPVESDEPALATAESQSGSMETLGWPSQSARTAQEFPF